MKKIFLVITNILLLYHSYAQTTNFGELGIQSASRFAIQGDYNNNNATIRIELGSASENNLLTATGNIALSGTLKVDLTNGYIPASSQSFTIISGNAVTGRFGNVVFPNGVSGSVIYNTNNVVVTITNANIQLSLSGPSDVCAGNIITITPNIAGGIFTSLTVQASVDANGLVKGITAGTATIKYSLGSSVATKNIVVNNLPAIPSIIYASGNTINPQAGAPRGSWCANRTFIVQGVPGNGIWSTTGILTAMPAGTPSTTASINTGAATGSGNIIYTVSNGSNCNSSRIINLPVAVCATKGLSNQQATNTSFTVYPNPAHSVINLKTDKLVTGNIVVTDLYGKPVKHQLINVGINTIDVSNFTKGIYFVSVVTEQGKHTQKILVE